MPLRLEQRLDRLTVRLAELRFWLDRDYRDLTGWQFDDEPLPLGEPWPDREGVKRFAHSEVAIPADWPLEQTRLELDLGGESLVRLRYAVDRDEAFGLDPNHCRFPLRERSFSIEACAVARFPFGEPNRDARLGQARLVLVEPALEPLVRRLQLVIWAAGVLGEAEVVEPMLDVTERALAILDWPSTTHPYLSRTASAELMQRIWSLPAGLDAHPPPLNACELASLERANEQLEGDLQLLQERYPPQGNVCLTGHAHIDLAWLWPLGETRRKAQRSFHTAIGLAARYPEFTFNQSSPQLYAFIEEDDPALFARVGELVAAGQWEPIGGMWVESDTNMSAGESLVRQLLYGQRFFQQRFGSINTISWLPDCFGFTPALPQLLRGAGIESFFTTKLTWSETNQFPHDLFWWEGLDGSRVLAHMFRNPYKGYNSDVSPEAVLHTWQNYRGKHLYPETLLSVGYGDGGGGPTAEMVERVRELAHFPALPRAQFGKVTTFYERARQAIEGKEVPVWVGELYLELHRGTLTTQGRTKRLHRQAERDLVAAEVLGSLHALLGGPEPESLEDRWRVVLRNEFHDILPGSSIREVYVEAEDELAEVVREAGKVIDAQLDQLARKLAAEGDHPALFVVNPDLSPRPLRVEIPGDLSGAQPVRGGSVLSGAESVPGLGLAVVPDPAPPGPLDVSDRHLENQFLRATLDEQGRLSGVYDKRNGREVLAGRGNQLWAYVDKPRDWDAWDIDASYTQDGEELGAPRSVEVVESGPHRVAVRIERPFRQSCVTQEFRLWSNSARLEFKTTLDWHDRHWLLMARFPLAVRARQASFETAFGVIERPTHRNTPWDEARFEVAAQRFVDLSEPGYGVALLNNGKYGHHAIGNELGISLLRSPTYPDPLADEGIQEFTYALFPHKGGWLEGGVLMEAEDLNRPLLARACRAREAATWQPLRLDGLPLGLGALKAREDGSGLILRVYEPQGARGPVQLNLPADWTLAGELDLLERPSGDGALSLLPFQVRTWLLNGH